MKNEPKIWTEKKMEGRPIEYAMYLRPLTEEELTCAEVDIAFNVTFDLSTLDEGEDE